MRDADYVQFLQTYLPRLGFRWPGFRRVRGQVIKRIKRRLRVLCLPDLSTYAAYLDHHPEEWTVLDGFCRITISRFYRDPAVFDKLRTDILPRLARLALTRQPPILRCWSAGCASGEEVYTLQLLWHLGLLPQFPAVRLHLIATDVDENLLERARRGRYTWGSVKALPPTWIEAGFRPLDGWCEVRDTFREALCFVKQDIRRALPAGPFHLILCRNLVFTYFAASLQRTLLEQLVERLVPGGVLVVGKHEVLPPDEQRLVMDTDQPCIYQKDGGSAAWGSETPGG